MNEDLESELYEVDYRYQDHSENVPSVVFTQQELKLLTMIFVEDRAMVLTQIEDRGLAEHGKVLLRAIQKKLAREVLGV